MQLSTHLAEEQWARQMRTEQRPPPEVPTLVIFVGIPLSGKSSVARALARAATTRTVHVENDALRERISQALGQEAPSYDRRENFLTYQTAWRLVGLGLDGAANAIHDATNFTEAGRRGAYHEAELRGAPVVVVFVHTERAVTDARAGILPDTRQEAYAKLGRKQPNPEACSRSSLLLDGAAPVEANLERMAADVRFRSFFATGP